MPVKKHNKVLAVMFVYFVTYVQLQCASRQNM